MQERQSGAQDGQSPKMWLDLDRSEGVGVCRMRSSSLDYLALSLFLSIVYGFLDEALTVTCAKYLWFAPV